MEWWKDSAIALYEILKNQNYQISALLTTLTEGYDRISMHGVRRTLLERQVASLGFPLEKVFIPKNASNEEYETNMGRVLAKYKDAGVTLVVFGDIFLEDLRKYREDKLATLGLHGIFPLWKWDTQELARSLIALGFKAITTCVDTTRSASNLLVDRSMSNSYPNCLPQWISAARMANIILSYTMDQFSKKQFVLQWEKSFYEKTVFATVT